MKTRLLLPFFVALLTCSGHSATVLSNFTGTATSNQAIKGPGGFIPAAIQYGIEFTANGVDHDLSTITLNFGNTLGTQSLLVELFASPTGPNNATFLTSMNGPSVPSNQNAIFTPATPQTLVSGATYFLKLYVPTSGAFYSLNRTSEPFTGPWSFDGGFISSGSTWSATSAPWALLDIQASPIPETAASLLGGLGCLVLLRRRR
jgi:hypothetical protein